MFSPLPVSLQAVVAVSPGDSQGFAPPLIRFDMPSLTCQPPSPLSGGGGGWNLLLLHNGYLELRMCSQTGDVSGPQEGGEIL